MLAQVPSTDRITNPALGNNIQNLTGANFFGQFVPMLINLALIIAVVIFLFVLIWGAISWMTSGGDKSQVKSARGKVVSAIAGLVLLFSAWAIINLIEGFFGTNILTLDILNLAIQ